MRRYRREIRVGGRLLNAAVGDREKSCSQTGSFLLAPSVGAGIVAVIPMLVEILSFSGSPNASLVCGALHGGAYTQTVETDPKRISSNFLGSSQLIGNQMEGWLSPV
jgi:hypothetical protein